MGNGNDDEPKTTESRPVEPLKITVVAVGDASKLPSGTEATTEGEHLPNIITQAVQPIVAMMVRFINRFLVQLSGLLVAGITPVGSHLLAVNDFWHLLVTASCLSLPGACMGLIKDLVTIFGRLEQKFPMMTGKV